MAKKKFKKAERIEHVYGVGVDSKKFGKIILNDIEKEKLRKSIGIDKDNYIIIYVAELSDRKNQEMLIRAIELLEDNKRKKVKVLLVGKDSKNGKYHKLVNKLVLEKNILFLGYRNDINKLMQIANLAVSTSKQEGLPVNIIEAMFMQLPIIATDCRGNRDLINKCVEINNYKQLEEEIVSAMDTKYQTLKYEVDAYKIENVMKKVEQIYKETIRYE